ncbi:hypothetical protein [Amycolatopsis sp. H20-H5]|uniref:hypothetical protein n=1 Tax=Amycolatopsis sp. H20-H5 TaxID=3046309 RepID=UPI002DB8B30F|nr:hypothetical protein [Amycolatopsis sp. H20-H5]MEC3979619.1 hypothetical protein [Amycolatopsis sp. H20-H5]
MATSSLSEIGTVRAAAVVIWLNEAWRLYDLRCTRWPARAIADVIRERTGPDSETSIMLAEAARVWSVADDKPDGTEPQEAVSNVEHADDNDTVTLPENPGALLAQLRRAADHPPCSGKYWNDAVARAATGTVSPSIARAAGTGGPQTA